MNKIAVVIVTYNRKILLKECLMNVLKQTYSPTSIIIVDNNSSDGTDVMLRENGYLENPIIQYHRLEENTGGSGGFHFGLNLAYEQQYDWIWIMDDDVSPELECLNELIKATEERKELVFIPLRISKEYKIAEMASLKSNIEDYLHNQSNIKKIGELYSSIDEIPKYTLINDMAFEGPLINRKVIEKIGLPIKEFFIFFDDTEYSFRSREITDITLVSSARLVRKINAEYSFGWKDYYYLRNKLLFERKYSNSFFDKFIRPIIRCCRDIYKNIIKLKFNRIPLIVKAYWDGYFNKLGKKIDPVKYKNIKF